MGVWEEFGCVVKTVYTWGWAKARRNVFDLFRRRFLRILFDYLPRSPVGMMDYQGLKVKKRI